MTSLPDGVRHESRVAFQASKEEPMPDLEPIPVSRRHGRRPHPGSPTTPPSGVVVLHAWWGLNADAIAYADRLADAGLRGRRAGHVPRSGRDRGRGRGTAVAGAATRSPTGSHSPPSTTSRSGSDRIAPARRAGFSFGAGYAIWAPVGARPPRRVGRLLRRLRGRVPRSARLPPLLGHFAEEDPFTSEDEIRELEDAFRRRRPARPRSTAIRRPGTGSPSRPATPTARTPPSSRSRGRWRSSAGELIGRA